MLPIDETRLNTIGANIITTTPFIISLYDFKFCEFYISYHNFLLVISESVACYTMTANVLRVCDERDLEV